MQQQILHVLSQSHAHLNQVVKTNKLLHQTSNVFTDDSNEHIDSEKLSQRGSMRTWSDTKWTNNKKRTHSRVKYLKTDSVTMCCTPEKTLSAWKRIKDTRPFSSQTHQSHHEIGVNLRSTGTELYSHWLKWTKAMWHSKVLRVRIYEAVQTSDVQLKTASAL